MANQGIIFIEQLKISTTIGAHAFEQQIQQLIILDIAMQAELTAAICNDDLQYTIDYQQVSKVITNFVAKQTFKLIESLAAAIADLLLQQFNISWIKLTLKKPGALPNTHCVGVTIEKTTATCTTN